MNTQSSMVITVLKRENVLLGLPRLCAVAGLDLQVRLEICSIIQLFISLFLNLLSKRHNKPCNISLITSYILKEYFRKCESKEFPSEWKR